MMDKSTFSAFITSRGLSKSFTTSVYAVSRAILYPRSKIIVSCSTKEISKQLIKEKIEKELCTMSPTLRMELGDLRKAIRITPHETTVIFRNGSFISAINASDNVRGKRATLLIVDEYRMIPDGFETLNRILRPFLNVNRVPKCMLKEENKKKFKNFKPEENKEVYL